jgi:hypothetical protein
VISGVVISSGELKLTPSDLKAVFGRLGVRLRALFADPVEVLNAVADGRVSSARIQF